MYKKIELGFELDKSYLWDNFCNDLERKLKYMPRIKDTSIINEHLKRFDAMYHLDKNMYSRVEFKTEQGYMLYLLTYS